MGSEKPYVAGRCGECILPFSVIEEELEGGGLRVHFGCTTCGRREVLALSAADLAAWASRRRRRGCPAREGHVGSGP